MQLSTIAINEIDFQDETYLLQPVPCLEPPLSLVASIKRIGVLHPPLVEEVEPGRYRILSGRNRLQAARKLHLNTCDCRVLPNNATPLEAFSLLFEELIATKPPSLIEQAIFFQKIRSWLDVDESAHRFLPILGQKPHPYQVQKLLRLNNLEEVIQEAVHDGSLDAKVAWELEKLSFADRMALFEIITALKLSVANQKKITLICREVSVRTDTTIAAFLATNESQEILNDTGINPPQKTSRYMAWLQKKQFPRLMQAEEKFKDFCRSLQLPMGASVQHSPFFEKDEISLTLIFKDQNHLEQTLPNLFDALKGDS